MLTTNLIKRTLIKSIFSLPQPVAQRSQHQSARKQSEPSQGDGATACGRTATGLDYSPRRDQTSSMKLSLRGEVETIFGAVSAPGMGSDPGTGAFSAATRNESLNPATRAPVKPRNFASRPVNHFATWDKHTAVYDVHVLCPQQQCQRHNAEIYTLTCLRARRQAAQFSVCEW